MQEPLPIRFIVLISVAVLAAISLQHDARGVDIVLNFDAAQSDTPSFDPTGAGLISIFEHAEDVWQDIFEDSHTLTINFWYDDLSDVNGTVASHLKVADDGTRETEANIRVDTILNGSERNWFIDPTPANNSEFAMSQTLWRDLSSTQQSTFYSVGSGINVPETLEVGYTGIANASGPAAGAWDMVTSVVHEVGHALGLNQVNTSEIADNDFDFNPDFVFGANVAVNSDASGGTPDDAHLAPDTISLLCGSCAQTNIRRTVSHTDAFAIAAASDFTDLDVPRREYYGGSGWNTPGNWSGNAVPGAADDVYVRDPGPLPWHVDLNGNASAANLFISEGADVDTELHDLNVGDTIVVEGADSDLFVRNQGSARADVLIARDGAEVSPNTGGTIDVDTFQLDGATLIGAGTVSVDDLLLNNGTITAFAGTLTLTTSSTSGVFNLDGSSPIGLNQEPGVVNATTGSVVVDGSLTDAFHGTLNVQGNGNSATFIDGWTLGGLGLASFRAGILNLENDGAVEGGLFEVNGVINANAGRGAINADANFNNSATVNIAAGAELETNGLTTIDGATFNIDDGGLLDFDAQVDIANAEFYATGGAEDGRLRLEADTTYTGGTIEATARYWQGGDARVTGATTINGVRVNLDGDGATYWEIEAPLTVIADELDVDNSEFTGTFEINANPGRTGSLTINLPEGDAWTMSGDIAASAPLTGGGETLLLGSDINLTGDATIEGRVISDARLDISGSVNVTFGGAFQIAGGDLINVNTIRGGQINGPLLRATSGRALVGNGTINTDVEFLGNSELRADNGTLLVNGALLDAGVLGTADADGVLNVAGAWSTSVADLVDLRGGEVTGGLITNDGGTIRGHGRITSSSINNFGTIAANGGTLVIDTVNPSQLDGAAPNNGQGILRAVFGDIEVASNVTTVFNGMLEVGPGHTFTMSQPGSRFRNAPASEDDDGSGDFGRIELDGGTVVASTFEQASRLTVTGTATLDADNITFEGGSVTEILGATDQLRLQGNTVIEPAAEFTGSVLVNDAGSSLEVLDGADVGVRLLNGARLDIGNSPGMASLDSLVQFGSGVWNVEIGGLVPRTEFDQLQTANDAQLAGTLEVELIDLGAGLFEPSLGDSFEILTAQTVTGQFQSIDASLAPLGEELVWNVAYLPTSVLLEVIREVLLAGDYNGNGQVEQADLDLVLLNWGQDGMTPPTGWTNDLPSGLIDQDELDGVLLNWGSSLAAASISAGPTGVPEPATAILLALGVVATGSLWVANGRDAGRFGVRGLVAAFSFKRHQRQEARYCRDGTGAESCDSSDCFCIGVR